MFLGSMFSRSSRSNERNRPSRRRTRGSDDEPRASYRGSPRRVKEYEDSLRVIRKVILQTLNKEQKIRIFQTPANEERMETRQLLDHFVEQYHLEKFDTTDVVPAMIVSAAQRGTHAQNIGVRRKSVNDMRNHDDTRSVENHVNVDFDENESDLAILRSKIDDLQYRLQLAIQSKPRDMQMWESSSNKEEQEHEQEVEKLRETIEGWARSHRDLQAQKEKSDEEVRRLDDKLGRMRTELSKQSFAHSQEADKLRSNITEWKHYHDSTMQTAGLRHQTAIKDAVKETKDQVKLQYDGYMKNERINHDNEIRAKDSELGARDEKYRLLEEQMIADQAENQRLLVDKDTLYHREIAHLRSMHKEEMQDLKDKHLRLVADLKQTHEELHTQLEFEMQEQKNEYELRIAKITGEAEKEQRELEKRATLQREVLMNQAEKQKQGYEAHRAKLEADHAEEVRKMEHEHADQLAQAVRELRQKITSMNAILFARDGFSPVPDRLLKERFLSLRHDVQYLCRQSWRQDQSFWTAGALMKITTNPDKVREQILRDEIWWILHDRIFCSPFRMFGDEGRSLEAQWNSGCGKDPELRIGEFTWPKPTFEAEKFRYEAIKQCQTALKEPASHLDPRAKIKKGFIQSREGLIKALRAAISAVARADQAVLTDIDKLVKKAIGLWLEFELQRCRLMVTMPAEKVGCDEEKMKLAMERKLELSSLPALIRFGDDEGQDLDVRQTVGSCLEEVVHVS